MNRLNEIKEECIERAFPELTKGVITTVYKRMGCAYFEQDRLKKKTYHIAADTSLINASRGAVIGGMAHELAHILFDFNRNWLAHKIDSWIYSLSSRYETLDERRTDILVVERGLGRELLEFTKYANKRREDYNEKDGLTEKELKALLLK